VRKLGLLKKLDLEKMDAFEWLGLIIQLLQIAWGLFWIIVFLLALSSGAAQFTFWYFMRMKM
jgi:hypothetical protein